MKKFNKGKARKAFIAAERVAEAYRWAKQKARIMAAPRVYESVTEKAERLEKEHQEREAAGRAMKQGKGNGATPHVIVPVRVRKPVGGGRGGL